MNKATTSKVSDTIAQIRARTWVLAALRMDGEITDEEYEPVRRINDALNELEKSIKE